MWRSASCCARGMVATAAATDPCKTSWQRMMMCLDARSRAASMFTPHPCYPRTTASYLQQLPLPRRQLQLLCVRSAPAQQTACCPWGHCARAGAWARVPRVECWALTPVPQARPSPPPPTATTTTTTTTASTPTTASAPQPTCLPKIPPPKPPHSLPPQHPNPQPLLTSATRATCLTQQQPPLTLSTIRQAAHLPHPVPLALAVLLLLLLLLLQHQPATPPPTLPHPHPSQGLLPHPPSLPRIVGVVAQQQQQQQQQ
mmetsp:Transcript_11849/g.31098  ORF Transcript_11849/g.31098 Transcript_11849/m.31098 type:complete len:257 (-) Transcript_11849:2847-3617(-)